MPSMNNTRIGAKDRLRDYDDDGVDDKSEP